MFLAFMSWIWMNIPMNDISWKWKGELLLLTTNSLIHLVWQIYRLMTHDTCSQSRNVRCVQQVAEGEGWVEESVIPGPGPRGLSEVVTSIIGVTQRLWPVSLSLPQLSVTADTLLTVSHSEVSLSRPDSALRPVPVIKSVFCFLHNISLRCGNSKLMCCFVLRDPLMTLLYQLMKEEVMEI